MTIDMLSQATTSAEELAPLLDRIGGATDVSPAAGIVSPSVTIADVAALWVNSSQVVGLAAPPGINTGCVMNSSTGHSTPVAPPAVTAQELTHLLINSNLSSNKIINQQTSHQVRSYKKYY